MNLFPMKHFGKILHFTLIASAIRGGFYAMSPERLRNTNPDWILCSILLLLMPLFVLGIVQYSISGAKQSILRRPSWNRFSIDWWHDPLQCLHESTWFIGATAIGSAIRLPSTTATGFWTFGSSVSICLGLLLGQFLVYRLHRKRIVDTNY
jgi:hypothetical protein